MCFFVHIFFGHVRSTMGKQIHLATRVEASHLLASPDTIMQHMSIKIFQRREELIQSLVGTHIQFDLGSNNYRTGIVESVQNSEFVVRDGVNRVRVPVGRVVIA